jgi:hypothetical protein
MKYTFLVLSLLFMVFGPWGVDRAAAAENIFLATQSDVDAFAAETINGNLVINDVPSDPIVDLDGLRGLLSITGSLIIQSNTQLASIEGLSDLESVGGELFIGSNPLVPDLDALSGIDAVRALLITANSSITDLDGLRGLRSAVAVVVGGNDQLADVDGLSGLSGSISGGLGFTSNPRLTSIEGVRGITAVGGHLTISGNERLQNVDGLRGIRTVGATLRVLGNPALEDLDGLSGLETVGNFVLISGNDALRDLDGLSSLRAGGSFLRVTNNTSLGTFCGLYPLFEEGTLAGEFEVSGNLSNPTESEILAAGPCALEDVIDALVAEGALTAAEGATLDKILDNAEAVLGLTKGWVRAGKLDEADAQLLRALLNL